MSESDISRLNHAAGSIVRVDPATVVLLQAMLDGWRATRGAFDPTLLAALAGLGYAASWHDPASTTSLPAGSLARGDLEQMWIDHERNLVRAPAGQCLDAGGIGKGLAADMVAAWLLEAGADGASVSIGGDVAVRGAAPQVGGWLIGIADPLDEQQECGQLAMIEGGVATSGTQRRCWVGSDGESVHHLLNPSTQRPAHHARQIVAATVVAGTAAWAEVWTKAVMVNGTSMLAVLDEHGLGAQVSFADSTTLANESWSSFACSRKQRRNLAGDEVDMIEI